MKWLVAYIKWIMLVAGILTASMFYTALAPHASMLKSFGQSLESAGPLAELVVRNWGFLIGLVGLMLIYGAFVPPARRLVLSVATVSKIWFVALLLTIGSDYLNQPIRVALIVDSLEVLLFLAYLFVTGRQAHALVGTGVGAGR
jgi:hypothetical protein